jgi:hypothetical protein
MICKPCQIAGDMVAEARSMNLGVEEIRIKANPFTAPEVIEGIAAEFFLAPTKEAVRSVAHLFHGLCKGSGHCDCQHKVDFEGKTISNGRQA